MDSQHPWGMKGEFEPAGAEEMAKIIDHGRAAAMFHDDVIFARKIRS